MEKTWNDLVNFSDIPTEIQQEIAAYLDGPALGFFAQSNKQILKSVLPSLVNYQATLPLRLVSGGDSTYLYQANQLFVCGCNNSGQLGLSDKEHQSKLTAVPWPAERGEIKHISAGTFHTTVLTHANQLWVCGSNVFGQLGLSDKKDRATFTEVPWPQERGKIEQVINGSFWTLVLTQDNTLWVCGANEWGQLGLGYIERENRATFTAVPWPAERGRIEQVIAGMVHNVVLTEDKRLWSCGYNCQGVLGLGDNVNRSTFTVVPWPEERGKIEQVIAGSVYTLVLTDDNCLWVCGCNHKDGQLELREDLNCTTFTAMPWPAERGQIKQIIASGRYHILMLTEDNCLWVCGPNDHGQLGLGDKEPRFTFTAVPWPAERGQIQQVSGGTQHTVVLTNPKRLWGCGYNYYGQLGLRDTVNRDTFTSEKEVLDTMKQIFTLNNNLDQLIKFGTALMLMSNIELNDLDNEHQSDQPESQLPLKKMRL